MASYETTAPRPSRPARAQQRRWRVPPPYLHAAEALEGATVLEEVPGPLGMLLWHCMRDVTLWATTPVEQREGLFAPEAEQRRLAALLALGPAARELEAPLRAIAAMLSHAPDTAPEAMMLACQRVSQWAEAGGALGTALAFAQAAALAVPAAARPALRVGRLARQRGDYARAEGWLQRCVVLARQGGEREVHAWGYSALGNLHRMRGNLPLAERCHLRALRIARRNSLISREGAALHDLFVVSMDRSRHEDALHWARAAAAVYGPRHANYHALAHDVAVLWLEQGRYGIALGVFQRIEMRMRPQRNLTVVSNIAHSAGGASAADVFERCWTDCWELVEREGQAAGVPSALLSLARGAAALGQLDRARDAALRAQELAHRLGEGKTQFEVEALLASLAAEHAATPRVLEHARDGDELAAQFAGELVEGLSLATV